MMQDDFRKTIESILILIVLLSIGHIYKNLL